MRNTQCDMAGALVTHLKARNNRNLFVLTFGKDFILLTSETMSKYLSCIDHLVDLLQAAENGFEELHLPSPPTPAQNPVASGRAAHYLPLRVF